MAGSRDDGTRRAGGLELCRALARRQAGPCGFMALVGIRRRAWAASRELRHLARPRAIASAGRAARRRLTFARSSSRLGAGRAFARCLAESCSCIAFRGGCLAVHWAWRAGRKRSHLARSRAVARTGRHASQWFSHAIRAGRLRRGFTLPVAVAHARGREALARGRGRLAGHPAVAGHALTVLARPGAGWVAAAARLAIRSVHDEAVAEWGKRRLLAHLIRRARSAVGWCGHVLGDCRVDGLARIPGALLAAGAGGRYPA